MKNTPTQSQFTRQCRKIPPRHLLESLESRLLLSTIIVGGSNIPDFSSAEYLYSTPLSFPTTDTNGAPWSTPTNLISDAHGNLFGLTSGTSQTPGILFEIPANATQIVQLASIDGVSDNKTGTLIVDANENIFGVTSTGGTGSGSIFEFNSTTQSLITLASFNGTNGATPNSILEDFQGNLFGTTFSGGTTNNGTVFELPASSNTLLTIVDFNGSAGVHPTGLVQDSHGNLLGVTSNGGPGDFGTQFQVAADLRSWSTQTTFNQYLDAPFGRLIIDPAGNLFGLALPGTSGWTEGYRISPEHQLDAQYPALSPSPNPGLPGMAIGPDGDLYLVDPTNDSFVDGRLFKFQSDEVSDSNITLGYIGIGASGPEIATDPTGDVFAIQNGSLIEFTHVTMPPAKIEFKTTGVNIEGANGHRVAGDNSNITFSIQSGPAGGTLLGPTTFQAQDGSLSPPTLYASIAGNYTVIASDGNLTPSPPESMQLGPPPILLSQTVVPTAVAGTPFTIQLNVIDALNDPVTSLDGTVIQICDPHTFLPIEEATITGGTLTFSNLTFDKAGNQGYFVQAPFNLNQPLLFPPINPSVTVTPDSKHPQLSFTQNPSEFSSNSATATVSITDPYGNLIPTTGEIISLALNSGNGTIGGNTSAFTINGIATFANISFSANGTYSLQASDAHFTPTFSTSFHFFTDTNQTGSAPTNTSISIPKIHKSAPFGKPLTFTTSLKTTLHGKQSFTGNIVLLDQNGNTIANGTLNHNGKATFSFNPASAGNYTCTLAYTGDSQHAAPNSNPFQLTIPQAKPKLTLTPSSKKSPIGSNLTLTATLSAKNQSTPLTGTVTFMEGNTTLGSANVTSNHALLILSSLPLGSHKITAIYSGDTNFTTTTSRILKIQIIPQ